MHRHCNDFVFHDCIHVSAICRERKCRGESKWSRKMRWVLGMMAMRCCVLEPRSEITAIDLDLPRSRAVVPSNWSQGWQNNIEQGKACRVIRKSAQSWRMPTHEQGKKRHIQRGWTETEMPMPNAVVSQSPGGRRVSQERNRQRQHEKEVRKTSIKESIIFGKTV